MTNQPLTPDQRILGRENADRALGISRRDLLKAAAATPALAGFYFGYKDMGSKPGQGRDHRHRRRRLPGDDPFAQPRLPRLHRLLRHSPLPAGAGGQGVFRPQGLHRRPTSRSSSSTSTKEEMYADPDVEMIVIALPLWLHAPVAIEAMKAGKHVFTEKLMAHSISRVQGDVPGRRDKNRLLAVGHQRHYSVLYDNANLPGPERRPGRHPPHPGPLAPQQRPAHGRQGQRRQPDLRPQDRACPSSSTTRRATSSTAIAGSDVHPDKDKNIDYKKYGYKSLDELINWRLYNRTGAGLMAELGSHQLDACSIFLGKKHPLAGHRHRRHDLLQGRPRGRRPRLHGLRVPRPGRQGPGGRDLFVDQHQLVRRLRRDGHGLEGAR